MFNLEKKILLILSIITALLIILGIVVGVWVLKWNSPEKKQSISDEEAMERVLQSVTAPLSMERDEIAEGELEEILKSLSAPRK